MKDLFAPSAYPAVGFGNTRVMPLGVITLPVSFIDGTHTSNIKADFLVVDSHATFYGIIGWPLIHAVNTFPSSCHQLMFFRMPSRVGVIHGDQTVGRELIRIEYDHLTKQKPT